MPSTKKTKKTQKEGFMCVRETMFEVVEANNKSLLRSIKKMNKTIDETCDNIDHTVEIGINIINKLRK